MSNSTTAQVPATAADITTHDEWVAFYNAPRNISAFARTIIGEKLLADAAGGDYSDQVMVAYEVKGILRLEALTDDALEAEHASNEAAHLKNLGWDEYDVNDREAHYYEQGLIRALQDHRRAQRDEAEAVARYTGLAPLTHSPFAVLLAV